MEEIGLISIAGHDASIRLMMSPLTARYFITTMTPDDERFQSR